mgnify:CR=1 FL=1
MNGKIVAGFIVLTGAAAGLLIWWLQVYAFYQPVAFGDGNDILLTTVAGGAPEAILYENAEGIDADSSPLRFRACFTVPLSLGLLTETYQIYDNPTPTVGPGWFDCYNAETIGAALEKGQAIAFLSVHDIHPGVDRVVAVMEDGRAFAWHQLNDEMKD